mgnify:CR=1 FL=1
MIEVMPGAPPACPTLQRCDEWIDGMCHAHCYWNGEEMLQPNGDSCLLCSDDEDYTRRARRDALRAYEQTRGV